MSFPSQTLNWANNIKRKLSQLEGERTSDSAESNKKTLAKELYYGLWHRYGFKESLDTGNWAPWPHELNNVNCYTQAVANYIIAKLCDLNPILIEFIGFHKQCSTQRSGHSLVLIDIGENRNPEPWVIDQSFGMYGPATISKNKMSVVNLDAKQGRTARKDYNIEKFGFTINFANDEDQIVKNMNLLRSKPELVLNNGQRIEIPAVDSWQTEEPLLAPWFLKFIPDGSKETKGDIASRIILDRPRILSRGLEYRITLANNGNIKKEKLIGYYCEGMVWSDFTNPIPMLDLSPLEILPLLSELTKLPLKERAKFEIELMKESSSPSKKYEKYVSTARKSFETLRENRFYHDVILAISATEALYQNAKQDREYFLNTQAREKAIQELKLTDPLIAYYARATKQLRFIDKKRKKRKVSDKQEIKNIAGTERSRTSDFERFSSLLDPNRRENVQVLYYLTLESDHEKLEDILKHKPTFIDDAVDRKIFYDRSIRGREYQVHEIAKSKFRQDYEDAIFRGYTRIFAEFLGHFAVTWHHVSLDGYKQKIINKLS